MGLFGKRKKKSLGSKDTSVSAISAQQGQSFPSADAYTTNESIIRIEALPPEMNIDQTRLVKITDRNLLARVSCLFPDFVQAGTTASNAVRSITQTTYRAILPLGETLVKAKDIPDAFRGFSMGESGISHHALLEKANSSTTTIANATASVINIASMVVGQYYMTQINSELLQISGSLESISSFQNNEYRSKVFALTTQIKRILSFQSEILEASELRETEILHLATLEQECMNLLGQASLTIVNFTKKTNLDYKEYETTLLEVQNWYIYQKTLFETLHKISDLKFALHLGAESKKQCQSVLSDYISQVQNSLERLREWHESTATRLGIETKAARRKRVGLDGILHWIPGLFKEEKNFLSISEQTLTMIEAQTIGYTTEETQAPLDLFQENVELLAKDGEIYYLPPEQKST